MKAVPPLTLVVNCAVRQLRRSSVALSVSCAIRQLRRSSVAPFPCLWPPPCPPSAASIRRDSMHRQLFRVTAAAALIAVGACAQAGSLGSVLGGVLGAGAPTNSVSGTVQRVDTRNLQIIVQQSNGQ